MAGDGGRPPLWIRRYWPFGTMAPSGIGACFPVQPPTPLPAGFRPTSSSRWKLEPPGRRCAQEPTTIWLWTPWEGYGHGAIMKRGRWVTVRPMRMYADNHGGLLPEDPPFVQANPWIPLLRPFVGSSTNLFRCPADDFGEARVVAGRSSYVLNEYTASGNGDSQPYPIFGPNGEPIPAHEFSQRIDAYPRPSDTFLAFEVSNVGNSGPGALWHDDHTHPVTWGFGWQHVLADIDPTRHAVQPITCRRMATPPPRSRSNFNDELIREIIFH